MDSGPQLACGLLFVGTGGQVIPSNVCGTRLEMFPLRFGLEEVALEARVNEWRVTSGESQEEENLDSWSQFCEQAGEVARGDDVSGLVTGQHEQAAFVAGDEVIRVAGLCQRQQEVVARVG